MIQEVQGEKLKRASFACSDSSARSQSCQMQEKVFQEARMERTIATMARVKEGTMDQGGAGEQVGEEDNVDTFTSQLLCQKEKDKDAEHGTEPINTRNTDNIITEEYREWYKSFTNKWEKLFPEDLGFVKGVTESNDLPPNIFRDMLRQDKFLRAIRNNLVKKVIELLEEIAEDKDNFRKFNELKLGIQEVSTNRKELVAESSQPVVRKGNQMDIYYFTGESADIVSTSNSAERGFVVTYMT